MRANMPEPKEGPKDFEGLRQAALYTSTYRGTARLEPKDGPKTRRDREERQPEEKADRTVEPTPDEKTDEVHQLRRKETGGRTEPERTEMDQKNRGHQGAGKVANHGGSKGHGTPTIPP